MGNKSRAQHVFSEKMIQRPIQCKWKFKDILCFYEKVQEAKFQFFQEFTSILLLDVDKKIWRLRQLSKPTWSLHWQQISPWIFQEEPSWSLNNGKEKKSSRTLVWTNLVFGLPNIIELVPRFSKDKLVLELLESELASIKVLASHSHNKPYTIWHIAISPLWQDMWSLNTQKN